MPKATPKAPTAAAPAGPGKALVQQGIAAFFKRPVSSAAVEPVKRPRGEVVAESSTPVPPTAVPGPSASAQPQKVLEAVRQALPLSSAKHSGGPASIDEDDEDLAMVVAAQQRARESSAVAEPAASAAPADAAGGSEAEDETVASEAEEETDADQEDPEPNPAHEPLCGQEVRAVGAASDAGADEVAAEIAAEVAAEGANPNGLSAYELERQANIARNRQVLAELGLLDDEPLIPSIAKPRVRPAKPKRVAPPPPPPPSRRSLRSVRAAPERYEPSGVDGDFTAAGAEGERKHVVREEEEEVVVEEDLEYDNSSVLRYLCEAGTVGSGAGSAAAEAPSDAVVGRAAGGDAPPGPLKGWREAGCGLQVHFKGIYGADVALIGAKPLLAVGGADGCIGLFPAVSILDAHAPAEPLIEWKAHSGWIGEVQFATEQSQGRTLMLSASNDATCASQTAERGARRPSAAVRPPAARSPARSPRRRRAAWGASPPRPSLAPASGLAQKSQHRRHSTRARRQDSHRGGLLMARTRACGGSRCRPHARTRARRSTAPSARQPTTGTAPEPLTTPPRAPRSIRLWDVNQSGKRGRSEVSQEVSSCKLSPGIFSLHEVGGRVISSGKDRCVSLTLMANTGLRLSHKSSASNKVVKCCRWRDGHVLASCDDAGTITSIDTRQPKDRAGVHIEDAHPAMIHTVRWSPRDEHILLSAGNDKAIRLWDMRKPSSPLHLLQGHQRQEKAKGIYTPSFCDGGACVSAVGSDTSSISVYSVDTGSAVSRGRVDMSLPKGATVQALPTCPAMPQEVLAVASGANLMALLPCY